MIRREGRHDQLIRLDPFGFRASRRVRAPARGQGGHYSWYPWTTGQSAEQAIEAATRSRQPLEPIEHRLAQLLEGGERDLHLPLDAGGPLDRNPDADPTR
jgi:hypothetical protein